MSQLSIPDAFSLRSEHALITGGGSGIGLAVAQAVHAAGARVTLVGRREAELADAVRELGDRAAYVVHDITRFDAAPDLVARITRDHGPVTGLVNNAGKHLKKPALATTPAEMQDVMGTHIFGAHALAQAVLPGMIERRHGHVIFMASMASLFGIPLVMAYAAAKSAMVGMVRTMATEVSPHNVRVNAIAPGWIDTAMSRQAFAGDPQRKAKILGRTPLGRLGEPDDVGWAVVYLMSPAAKFVTGVVLPVDGGVSIGF
jgi:gluconate 5-dehydrogenase